MLLGSYSKFATIPYYCRNHLKTNKAVGGALELWSVSLYLISLNLAV